MKFLVTTKIDLTLQQWIDQIVRFKQNKATKDLKDTLPQHKGLGYGKGVIIVDVLTPLWDGFNATVKYSQELPYLADPTDQQSIAFDDYEILTYRRSMDLEDEGTYGQPDFVPGVNTLWSSIDATVDPSLMAMDRHIEVMKQAILNDIASAGTFGLEVTDFEITTI